MTDPTHGPTGARAREAESPAPEPVLVPRPRRFAEVLEALPRLALQPKPGRRYLTAADIVPPSGNGPGGRPWCAWCHEFEVVKGRRRYCSPRCQGLVMALISNLRGIVYERDGGCCRACGLDLELLEAVLASMYHHVPDLMPGHMNGAAVMREVRGKLGFGGDAYEALYHIDHIVPVELGGTSHPDNLQTLCIPCHGDKTAVDAGRIAQARRGRQEGAALELALDAKAQRGRVEPKKPWAAMTPMERIKERARRRSERRQRKAAARQSAKGGAHADT